MSDWQPIETYPNCTVCGRDDCDWGPSVVVYVPPTAEHDFPTRYVAHLEAGMWLAADSDDPVCLCELHAPPTRWAPLPGDN